MNNQTIMARGGGALKGLASQFELNDDELNQKVKILVGEERQITEQILLHIREVDQRKLHLALSYSSLFGRL